MLRWQEARGIGEIIRPNLHIYLFDDDHLMAPSNHPHTAYIPGDSMLTAHKHKR